MYQLRRDSRERRKGLDEGVGDLVAAEVAIEVLTKVLTATVKLGMHGGWYVCPNEVATQPVKATDQRILAWLDQMKDVLHNVPDVLEREDDLDRRVDRGFEQRLLVLGDCAVVGQQIVQYLNERGSRPHTGR
jgi:hypothetical protein